MHYLRVVLLFSFLAVVSSCKKKGLDFEHDENIDSDLKSEISTSKSKYWINNPSAKEGRYAINGGAWKELAPYALIPMQTSRGEKDIDVKIGDKSYRYNVDLGSDFTIINPGGIDRFQAVGQDYTTNQFTYFGSGRKTKTLRGEVIQRHIDYSFEQTFPKEIRMRLNSTKTMWKIYKLYPSIIPEGLAVRSVNYHEHSFKGGINPALKALANGTGPESLRILKKQAFSKNNIDAMRAIFDRQEYKVLTDNISSLDRKQSQSLATQIQQLSYKTKTPSSDLEALVFKGLSFKDYNAKNTILKAAIRMIPTDSPNYKKLQPYLKDAPDDVKLTANRIQQDNFNKTLKDAKSDDLIALIKKAKTEESVRRAVYKMRKEDVSLRIELGNWLATLANTKQRELVYSTLLKNQWGQVQHPVFVAMSKTSDQVFKKRIEMDRIKMGAFDKLLFDKMKTINPDILKNVTPEYVKGLVNELKKSKAESVWVFEAIDFIKSSSSRKTLINQVKYSLHHRISNDLIIKGIQLAKDKKLREELYSDMKNLLRFKPKTNALLAAIKSEPDKSLQSMLMSYLGDNKITSLKDRAELRKRLLEEQQTALRNRQNNDQLKIIDNHKPVKEINLNRASNTELLNYLKQIKNAEQIKKAIDSIGWKKDRDSVLASLGQWLASTNDIAQRDFIYAELIEKSKATFGDKFHNAVVHAAKSKDSKFAFKVAEDRIRIGNVDKALYAYLTKKKSAVIKEPTKGYMKSLSRILRDRKADRLWIILAVDRLNKGAERDKLIRELSFLPHRVPTVDLIKYLVKTKDQNLRKTVYDRMKFVLKQEKNKAELIKYINQEPNAQLKATLKSYLK